MLRINPDSLTRRFTGEAYRWIVTFGPRLVIAILIFFIGQWIIRFINKEFRNHVAARNKTLGPFIRNLIRLMLQGLLLLLIMQLLGIKMTLFAAIIASFGVAIGLALSGTMQNFAGGILILILKPFIVGDNIKTQDQEGTVTFIRLFYTVILTYKNVTLIVPNSKLSNEVIFNLTREKKRRMDITMKFSYAIAFEELKVVIINAINSFEQRLEGHDARVGIEKLEADGYTICINVWLSSHGFTDLSLQLNEQLLNALKPVINKK